MFILASKSTLFKVFSSSVLFFFILTFVSPFNVLAQTKVQVPVGTVVTVKTNTLVSPEILNVGHTVYLSVVSDVIVDDKVVIKEGATAIGEVTVSRELNYIGIPAKIGIAVRSVQAVDGSTIIISGIKLVEGKDKMVVSIGLSLICFLFALIKGGEADIPAGTPILCPTSYTITVNVQ